MNKKITILHVTGTMNRGGVETLLMNMLRNLNKDEFTFLFLCFDNDGKFDFEDEIIALGGKVIRTPDVKDVGPFAHIKNIKKIIKDEQVDIIHAHTYFNSMFSMIAGRQAGLRTRIVHSHNTKSEESPSVLKRAYFLIAKLIINTHATNYLACGRDAGNALFYSRNKFTVIDNGIILHDFYYNPNARNELKMQLGLADKTPIILHIGRFDTQKNHTFLIDIFNEYVKLNPESVLLLVGDGILREEMEAKVRRLKLSKKVMFLGKRSDTNKLYSLADLFLFPSLHEGLPVTMVEAQANGIPCLISDTIDKATKFTECVEFYPLHYTAKQWADHIKIMSLERSSTKKQVEGSKYDMTKNIKKVEELYKEMIAK